MADPKSRVRSWWSRASSAPSDSWGTWKSVVAVKCRNSDAPIQSERAEPSSERGGHQSITAVSAIGRAEASIQGRRRPKREVVRSDRCPARGSDTASQTREARNQAPITAGGTSSTSVAYFIR